MFPEKCDAMFHLNTSCEIEKIQGDKMIWKKSPNFCKVAKTVAKQNNAKLETIF
jgi:hypothetical protein